MNLFRVKRRVEFADTDMAGIAHFAQFFAWMETAEHEFLRHCGLSVFFEHDGQKYGIPRVSASCDYKKPLRFPDEFEVEIRLAKLGSSSLQYEMTFIKDNDIHARGTLSACLCRITDGALRAEPLPGWFRSAIAGTVPDQPQ